MLNQRGAQQLAAKVIEKAFDDLKTKSFQASSIRFFESPFYLALFCDLAELDGLAVYNIYRSMVGKQTVSEQSQQWLERGKVGIYKNGRLVAVAKDVAMACDICGITPPTLYKYARTGETTAYGYQVRKRITPRKPTGMRPHIKIEIVAKDGSVGYAIGYKQAAAIIGANPKRMQHILEAGHYRGWKLRKIRGYRHGDEK
ncbi:MAG: hypothetical protein EOM62_17080 [Bacteroidia bacterium]|nr:hypothetical protein [Bacteroidia bacterium]